MGSKNFTLHFHNCLCLVLGLPDHVSGLDQLSMAANGGLTDAEGALSDVNSIYDCVDIVGDPEMDDTSLSSRASSRIFDSDQIYSADSLHGM